MASISNHKEVPALQDFNKIHLPDAASEFNSPDTFCWHDSSWLAHRARYQVQCCPLNIYELHLDSWRRTGDGNLLNYREIAQFLVPYVKELGFTHVELLSVSDHFSTSIDFMYLVDELHRAGIGILLDWVFPFSPEDVGIKENTLISSALFWLETYHIDGLRPIPPSENCGTAWMAEFFRRLNEAVRTAHPDVLMVGSPPFTEDLGFTLTWNTNWTRRLLRYAGLDPYFRQYNHQSIAESPLNGSGQAILPLSHDEFVHNKGSLLNRMPGSDLEKYASVRTFYTYMLTYPGKKLTMMGCEFGQWDEWRHDRSLDWHLLEQQTEDGFRHRQLHAFFKAANAFYLESPALWQQDFSPEGFCWICPDDASGNITAFLRFDKKGHFLLVAANFSPVFREHYRIGVPQAGRYEEIFNSDLAEFGGGHRLNTLIKSENIPCHGMDQSLQIDLPPLSAVILKCTQKLRQKNNTKQVMK